MASAAEQLAANMNFSSFAKAKELQQRILFTIGILIVYRIGTFVPIPVLLDPERQYDFSAAELRREIAGRGLSAVLLSNPCNPTGRLLYGVRMEEWVARTVLICCHFSKAAHKARMQSLQLMRNPLIASMSSKLGSEIDWPDCSNKAIERANSER